MNKLAAPISVAKVAAFLGVVSGDVGTLCTSNKINKWSLRKPYAFGDAVTRLTDDVLRDNNCGITPNKHNVANSSVVPLAWSQWSAPTGSTQWKRLTDFNGYSHNAKPWLTNVRVWFTNPNNSEKPMASASPSQGNWKHYCKAEFTIDVVDNVSPAYMKALKDHCITLIFASNEDGGGRLSRDIYIEQTVPMSQIANGTYSLKVEIPYSMITDEGYTGKTIAVLCLAPKYATAPTRLELLQLFSLDTYDDSALRTMCVKANEEIASPIAPAIETTKYISAEHISSGIGLAMTMDNAVKISITPMVVQLDTNNYINGITYSGTLVICANGHFYTKKVTSGTSSGDQITVNFNDDTDFVGIPITELRNALGVTAGTSIKALIGVYVSGSRVFYGDDSVAEWVLNWQPNDTISDGDWDIWHEWMNEAGISMNGVGSVIEKEVTLDL